MNFFHNKIVNPVGSNVSFDDWVKNLIAKTASEAKPECEDESRGDCRGQVINNDNEKGLQNCQFKNDKSDQSSKKEKTDKKDDKKDDKKEASHKVEAKCGKEMGESSDAGKVTDKHTESAPGDDENKEPKILINNDPNYQKGESTNPGKVNGKNKKTSPKKAESTGLRKVASLNRNEKIQLFAHLASFKHNTLDYAEAMVGIKFANLTQEEKDNLKSYWKTIYPPEYVEEMVKDR